MRPGIAVATLVAALALPALAQNGPPRNPPPGEGRKPPPQAFADCAGNTVNAQVRHTTPEGVVAATCVATPDGLAARPNQPPERR